MVSIVKDKPFWRSRKFAISDFKKIGAQDVPKPTWTRIVHLVCALSDERLKSPEEPILMTREPLEVTLDSQRKTASPSFSRSLRVQGSCLSERSREGLPSTVAFPSLCQPFSSRERSNVDRCQEEGLLMAEVHMHVTPWIRERYRVVRQTAERFAFAA